MSTADPNARVWTDIVIRAAHNARQAKGQAEGAVSISLDFQMPTKAKDRWGKPHTFVPDADNLAKLALDAMKKAGLFKDDSSVSSLIVRKTWAQTGSMLCTLDTDRRAPTYIDPERPDWV